MRPLKCTEISSMAINSLLFVFNPSRKKNPSLPLFVDSFVTYSLYLQFNIDLELIYLTVFSYFRRTLLILKSSCDRNHSQLSDHRTMTEGGTLVRLPFDSQSVCTEIENMAETGLCDSFSSEVLSRITPSALNQNFENSFRILDKSFRNLMTLIIISWSRYCPEELGYLIRLEILDLVKDTDLDFLEILLESKGQCFCWILDTKRFSTRSFFGNIFNSRTINHALRNIKPCFRTRRRSKRVQRHRGYRDKGTLRREVDKHDLWYSSILQQKIEEERESRAETNQFIIGWIT